jgi:phosphatidylinositol glycan class M
VWVLAQAAWLADAYRLEFLGHDVFWLLWLKSLGYVTGNVGVLVEIMEGYGKPEGHGD